MKLSPLDIEHMEFPTGMGGYSKRQVREFLQQVAGQLETALRENQQLKDELRKLEARIDELQLGESQLKRAVVAAERIAGEIKENAKHEATLILREADSEREQIIRAAQEKTREAREELVRLEREQELFREQFRGLLKAFERAIDSPGEARRLAVNGSKTAIKSRS